VVPRPPAVGPDDARGELCVRIVVTGAGGGLGRTFRAIVAPHHDVHAFTHDELDIGSTHAVLQRILPIGPDAILNLAAFTRVDANEADPRRAWRDNAAGPQGLALAARECDAWLLHVSTDYVFDGTKGKPYEEFDEPRPLSVYAQTKLAGERLVRETWWRHVIVRTGHVFGGGDDYLSTALERLGNGEAVGGLADRFGSPTDVRELARRLLPIVLGGRPGTYHVAGPERTCWHDVLMRLKGLGELPGEVRPQSASELALPAPRPRDVALTSVMTPLLDIAPFPSLDESLAALLADRA
jgi:dTDP-4-dehydrorhamnose reductase